MSFGHPVLGVVPVEKSVLIIVPSFAWSSKLTYISRINPAWTETYAFGLQRINLVPTLLGLYIGFLGSYWLAGFAAIIGALCGWGERWLFRRFTPVRVVVMAICIQVVFKYEQGLPGILVTLRTAVVLAIAVKIIEAVQHRGAGRVQGEDGVTYPWRQRPLADRLLRPGTNDNGSRFPDRW